jgi:hypothetical protein
MFGVVFDTTISNISPSIIGNWTFKMLVTKIVSLKS